MEIIRADRLGHDTRADISRIFSISFGHWLTFFSKDTEVLTRAFTHMFLPECFYVAVIDGKIAGITA